MRRSVPQPVRYGDRPAFAALVACLLGLLLALTRQLLWGSIAIALLTLLLWGVARWRGWRVDPLLFLLPLLTIAYGWYADSATRQQRTLPEATTLYDVEVRINYPVASSLESALRYDATLRGVEGTPDLQLLLTLPAAPEDLYGVVVRGDLDLSSLTQGGKSNSYRRYLLSEGYDAQAYGQRLVPTGERSYTLRSGLMKWRSLLVKRFEEATESRLSYADRGLIYALCLGERLHLPREVKESFTTAGVAHILAVSGYHLGIVFGILATLLSLLLPAYHHRWIRHGVTLVGLLLYTLLTGASTATVRALVMSSIYLIGRIIGRRSDPIQVLSLTLLFFLLLSPYSIYSVGLILSISAVWGLMLLMPLLDHLVEPSQRWLRTVWSALAACFSAQIGVLPWLFLFFGTAAGSTLWSAVPVALLSSLLIPAGLLALGWVMLFGSLPGVMAEALRILSGGMRGVTDHFATPLTSLTVSAHYDLVLVVLYYGIVITAYELVTRLLRRRAMEIR